MDKMTHKARLQYWVDTLHRCAQECAERGISKQQWIREQGVSVKTFYNWQRRIREAASEQMESKAVVPASKGSVLAELPVAKSIFKGEESAQASAFHPTAILRVGDGDLEDAGHHTGYDHTGSPTSDVWLMKADHDGNVLWSRCYGGKGEDAGCIVFQNDDGGFTVFGVSESYDGDVQSGLNLVYAYNFPYGQKIWVFRTDANGNLLWERAIGNKGGIQYLGDVIQESDTEYIIAATSPAGNDPLYMGDYNCSNYNLCHGDSYWILHITDVFDYDGVEESLLQENGICAYPNPARDILTISGHGLIQVRLYDVLGQQVAMAHSYNGENAMLDTNGLSAGIYLVRVVTENGVVVKRIVVEK